MSNLSSHKTEDIKGTITVPMTAAQKEIWVTAKMGDEVSRAYNQSMTINKRGAFNLAAMRKAVQEIVNRHEALRTTFSSEGDEQRITPTLVIDIPVTDLSSLENTQREAQMSELLVREIQQTFDFERGPLLRVRIVKLEEEHHSLIFTIHHIVADGWSIGVLQQELVALYSAQCHGNTCQLPQAMQYSEYAQWLAHQQQSSEMVTAEAYWLEQFADLVPALELPTDRPRTPTNQYKGTRQQTVINTSVYKALKSLSVKYKCTLYTVLLAGFTTLLHRLTSQDDIVVGVSVAGQSSVGGERLVGHCVNFLPIRSQV